MVKYFLFILATPFILTSCGSSDCTYTHDSKEWSEEWSEDQEIVFEGERYNRDNNWIWVRKHNGEEITGSYCYFDSKGRQTRKEHYLNGRLNGLVLKFDKRRGIVEDTVTYENGYKEGRDVSYNWSDSENKLKPYLIVNYSKNLKNGIYMKYFTSYENGLQLQKKGNYLRDREDGYWEWYHNNGKIRFKRTYKDGWMVKLDKQYDDDGKIISVSEYEEYEESENGPSVKNEWTWRSHAFGKEVWCQVKKDGKYINLSFDNDGNIKSDKSYNKEHKNFVHYNFDGFSDWTVEGYSY